MHKGKKKNLTFSQRIGKKPIKKILQIESMDKNLRVALWNIFLKHFIFPAVKTYRNFDDPGSEFLLFCECLWNEIYREPIEELYFKNFDEKCNYIKFKFFNFNWNEVYDFIEFLIQVDNPNYFKRDLFKEECNKCLEKNFSAYRFIGNQITPITNEIEINEIEEALNRSKEFKLTGVTKHLEDSLSKLSERKNPDYRNSIKESISAVESICRVISGEGKASLGDALTEIEKKGKINIHKSLKDGFKKIYGYTSDEEGIRHAMLDEPKIYFEDAKYMLVSCSAFINYLIEKASKAGIF